MNALREQDNKTNLSAGQLGVTMATMPYKQQLMYNQALKAQAPTNVGTQPQRDPNSPTGWSIPMKDLHGNITFQPAAGPTASGYSAEQRNDVEHQAELKGAAAGASGGVRQDQTYQKGVLDAGSAADQLVVQNQTTLNAIAANKGVMGPGIVQSVARQINNAFPGTIANVDGADQGMLQKSVANLVQGNASAMHGVFPRMTNQELSLLTKSNPDGSMSPEAATTLVNLLNEKAQADQKVRDGYLASVDAGRPWDRNQIAAARRGAYQAEQPAQKVGGTWSINGQSVPLPTGVTGITKLN
jgi:hypothetical protein